MKGILEFNLEDSADEAAYIRAVKSTKLAVALWDMDQYLRSQIKHAPDSMPKKVYDALQEVRDKLHEIMSDNSIDLDELLK
jgi:ATP-dependent helicase/DNAse subunit B